MEVIIVLPDRAGSSLKVREYRMFAEAGRGRLGVKMQLGVFVSSLVTRREC